MTERTDPLRVIRARWCLLAAVQPVLAAAGSPLPFRVSAEGGEVGVARYDASSTAGATLAWFGTDRALLSCGDLGWRVPGAPSTAARMRDAPSWSGHVSVLDHRVSAGHFGWVGACDGGTWTTDGSIDRGAPLPPVLTSAATAGAIGARLECAEAAHHLTRMCEYEWLDAASWEGAFGGLAPRRHLDEGWDRLDEFGLTQWSGSGPVVDGVPGPTPGDAIAAAADYARSLNTAIPDEVRVESALRAAYGWRVRFADYRDAASARPLEIMVPDGGRPHLVRAESIPR